MGEKMRLSIKEKGKIRLNKFLDWLIYMFFYTLILIIVSKIFDSMYIDTKHYYIYCMLITLIVYILNKTIKPVLVKLTIPITGITLGLFYPFINLFILKVADWILSSHFNLENFFIALIISILISVSNFLVDGVIIRPILRKFKKDGDKIE